MCVRGCGAKRIFELIGFHTNKIYGRSVRIFVHLQNSCYRVIIRVGPTAQPKIKRAKSERVAYPTYISHCIIPDPLCRVENFEHFTNYILMTNDSNLLENAHRHTHPHTHGKSWQCFQKFSMVLDAAASVFFLSSLSLNLSLFLFHFLSFSLICSHLLSFSQHSPWLQWGWRTPIYSHVIQKFNLLTSDCNLIVILHRVSTHSHVWSWP